ncbi:peptidoglycan hydrolase CwlO-like protein [Halarchaeum rubridurum]|uniref:Peptidoglycan hydrolase CwlO-like protein n=1 Tax=Halarchaeum rubridurum TaxID=489911 RepID=A0A830G1V4_9EURY|nr:hypothetical protein [Halarchaeum rubridurum]MBP1955328.1 peptidoglycan hydrolase CwlO-like protein [Halarchaeum rubridurum]GGM71507.1 hypothetical protein GCM10009017_21830 [Halarchaeum rubridurum]
MSNDSEDVAALENRVKELEATVRGLTEELVDANERIRELENHHDAHESAGRPASEPLAAGAPDEGGATEEATESADAAAAESGDAAAAEPEDTPAEGAEETDEESELDDIIVA